MTKPCPHPQKHAHVSCAAALVHLEHMDRAGKADLTLHPYRCVCGSWHLGHRSPGSVKQQLKKALRAGTKNTRASRRRRKR